MSENVYRIYRKNSKGRTLITSTLEAPSKKQAFEECARDSVQWNKGETGDKRIGYLECEGERYYL